MSDVLNESFDCPNCGKGATIKRIVVITGTVTYTCGCEFQVAEEKP